MRRSVKRYVTNRPRVTAAVQQGSDVGRVVRGTSLNGQCCAAPAHVQKQHLEYPPASAAASVWHSSSSQKRCRQVGALTRNGQRQPQQREAQRHIDCQVSAVGGCRHGGARYAYGSVGQVAGAHPLLGRRGVCRGGWVGRQQAGRGSAQHAWLSVGREVRAAGRTPSRSNALWLTTAIAGAEQPTAHPNCPTAQPRHITSHQTMLTRLEDDLLVGEVVRLLLAGGGGRLLLLLLGRSRRRLLALACTSGWVLCTLLVSEAALALCNFTPVQLPVGYGKQCSCGGDGLRAEQQPQRAGAAAAAPLTVRRLALGLLQCRQPRLKIRVVLVCCSNETHAVDEPLLQTASRSAGRWLAARFQQRSTATRGTSGGLLRSRSPAALTTASRRAGRLVKKTGAAAAARCPRRAGLERLARLPRCAASQRDALRASIVRAAVWEVVGDGAGAGVVRRQCNMSGKEVATATALCCSHRRSQLEGWAGRLAVHVPPAAAVQHLPR